MLESSIEGRGWLKSLQCFSMAKVVDLEVFFDSLTKSPGGFPNVGGVTSICLALSSGRLDLSFGRWRLCPLGASAWILRCWLPWNRPVLACTWRFSCRIHSTLGNKVLRCRITSLSHSLFQGELEGLVYPTFLTVWSSTVGSCCSGALYWGALFPWLEYQDLNRHSQPKADGCNSSYIGETSRALGERVKEHSKSTTLAILKHCKDFHHPLPSIDDFNIIDKEPSQITREAKEAIHIRWLDPSLNRNIGKMSIPHCFDHLLGAKPRHPRVGVLSAPLPVDEMAPLSQIPGLNLTQFNNIGKFRPNVALHIPRPSTRACRAKNLFNWVINWRRHNKHTGQAL